MNKINKALSELDALSQKSLEDNWLNRIHPLVKFVLTILYICLVVSIQKYKFYTLLAYAVLPLFIFTSGVLSFKEALFRMRLVYPVIIILGIFNPLLDHSTYKIIYDQAGNIIFTITGGMISFITLLLKGFFTVTASYIFIASTSIEKLCHALALIHVPTIIITQILLIYRYISVLLIEVKKITQAYSLRAPEQKGINIKAWGPLVGNLLLRTMDRSQNVYESMCLRGFDGTNGYFRNSSKLNFRIIDGIILVFAGAAFIALKYYPIIQILGELFS